MARRKSAVVRARTDSTLIVADSGNALFKEVLPPDGVALERAQLILAAMGEMGVAAMAVGARDLSAGVEFLKTEAARCKVPLLSVNLVDSKGTRLFPGSRIVGAAGTRVALVGASLSGAVGGVRGLPPVAEALREAKRLRSKADVVVALAAMPYADALQLAQESDGAFDFVLQSGESRGEGLPESMGKSFVIRSGERGRQLGSLALTFGKEKGTFRDAGERERTQQSLRFLETQIDNTRRRIETAPSESVRKSLEQTLAGFEGRRARLIADLTKSVKSDGRNFILNFISLGEEVPDDPRLREQVARLEPTPPAAQ